LKYLLLGFFVWAVLSMSANAIVAFMRSPYGIVADVKMLNFFRFIGHTGLIVLGVLGIASVLVQNFWCRYLCPYGALLGISSLLSPMKIRRNAEACIDCVKCAKACPSALPVDKLVTIKSVECTGCLECVAVCPAEGALRMGLPAMIAPRSARRMPTWAFAAGVAALFFGIVGFAKTAGYWNSNIPLIRVAVRSNRRCRCSRFGVRFSRATLPGEEARLSTITLPWQLSLPCER
jgi:polyferredoxin